MTDVGVTRGEDEVPETNRNPDYLTVRTLIRLLAEYPPDLRVVVEGYEAGYDDLSKGRLQRVRIALGVGEEWWVGEHEDSDLVFPKERRPSESVEALVLRRRSE
jgi:hypothetical protein